MAKFRRKPEIIDAEQFKAGSPPWPPGVAYDAEENIYTVWNDLHRTAIKLKFGDWVRTDKPLDRYPIDEETFKNTYEPVED